MRERALLILNPAGGRGGAGRRWRRLEPRVRDALGRGLEIERTRRPGDAERLAREAVRAGVSRLIVAGGDGTLNEVVCGLLGANLGRYAELGLLPLGTGCDFARSLGVPVEPEAALDLLACGAARAVDAGRIQCLGADGEKRERHFVNVASLGVSSLAVELAGRSLRGLGPRAAFALGTVRALLRHRPEPVVLRVDGREVHAGRLVLAAVASGRHFGGGMLVAPEASLDDGRFEVIAVQGVPALRLLGKLPKLYRGRHLDDPIVSRSVGRVVEAEAPEGPVPLEADGELVGRLPARFEMLPGALRILAPA